MRNREGHSLLAFGYGSQLSTPKMACLILRNHFFLGTLVQHDPTHTQFFSTSEPFELIYFKGTAHRRNLPQDGTYTPDPRPSVGGNDWLNQLGMNMSCSEIMSAVVVVVVGGWLLVIGCWLFVVGCWLVVVGGLVGRSVGRLVVVVSAHILKFHRFILPVFALAISSLAMELWPLLQWMAQIW